MPRLRAVVFILSVLGLCTGPALAVMNTSAEHAILMDAASGQVLWSKDGYKAMPPASMSKLMTLELVFQRLKDGRLKPTDTLPVSQAAWLTGGSKGFVRVNDRLTIQDLVQRIIVASANDACVVVAEGLGGTVPGFVNLMNQRAKELGLTTSHFVNPDGLPDPPGQLMSAYDLAKLARHLIYDYPQFYHYFGERSYTVTDQGKSITQPNRNTVLEKFPGSDGLKTGYTDAAGYSITTSAVQDGRRMILVLGGLRYPDLDKDPPIKRDWIAEQRRGDEASRVLGMAFREFRTYQLFKPEEVAGVVRVWGGSKSSVPVTPGTAVAVTMQVDSRAGMKVAMRYNEPVRAPVAQGQQVGTLVVTAPDFPDLKVPLYATQPVPRAGIFGRMMMGMKALFSGHGSQ
jgi:serine-type D-Ala-D-Ala carboxypeptidase (penicillin-binding protein 5/6)